MRYPSQHLALPFFEEAHRRLAADLSDWVAHQQIDETDVDAACRTWVKALGSAGWLRYCVPASHGGIFPVLDSRCLVLIREVLAFHSALADFAFAMQGLGSGPVSLVGTETQKQVLHKVARGEAIAAFALSEPMAGSDVAAMQTTAVAAGSDWTLSGEKTWISNGGIADFYLVFAKTDAAAGARGISCFYLAADTPGLRIAERIDTISPHPLARLQFDDCRVPDAQRVGPLHGGFKLAMQTLDIFRVSVAGASLGLARRAFAEARQYACHRPMFGQNLSDFQLTQSALGDMALRIDAAALLSYRAAWQKDVQKTNTTQEAAMAKLCATESAQWVIDRAVQMHGALGVTVGQKVEALYRDIRAMRIYEGASEVQSLIIGRSLLKEDRDASA
jgi:acyl-CoA dehydrogenase